MKATPISRRDAPLNEEQENKFLPLLRAMLSCLRRSRETPLQFEIDSEGIVAAVLRDFPDAILSNGASRMEEWAKVEPVLHALVERLLRTKASIAPAPLPGISPLSLDHHDPAASVQHPLAGWLERFYQAMRQVHPQAIDIVGLRLEGFQERDIAGRLGFGLRLVRSILNGMQANWKTATGGS